MEGWVLTVEGSRAVGMGRWVWTGKEEVATG